jgi:hypothetical protein
MTQLTGWFSGALKDAEMKPKLAKQGLFPVGMCGARRLPAKTVRGICPHHSRGGHQGRIGEQTRRSGRHLRNCFRAHGAAPVAHRFEK